MKKRILTLFLAALMLLSCCACGAQSSEEPPAESKDMSAESSGASAAVQAPETGVIQGDTAADAGVYERRTAEDTLTVGLTRALLQLCPGNTNSNAGLSLVFNKLITFDPETGEYNPELATKWSYDDDSTLHLWLRDDVKWSDGSQFTAEDVLFTIEWLKTKAIRGADDFQCYDIDNCEIINDYELTLKTYGPNGPQLANLCSSFAYIICEKNVESMSGDDAWWDGVVGTGPFKVVTNVSGDSATFVTNEYYWGEAPNYSNVVIRYYSDASTMFMDYQTGSLDMIFEPTLEDYNRVVSGDVDHSYAITFSEKRVYTFVIYEGNEYFSDPVVREAIYHAIDTQTVTEVAWGDMGVATSAYTANGVKYNFDPGVYEYNPEYAKQLLEEAGYQPGEIVISSVYGSSEKKCGVALEVIQSMLEEIGITLTIETYDNPTMTAMLQGADNNGIPEIDSTVFSKSILSYDPSAWYSVFLSSTTMAVCGIQDEHFNEMVSDGANSIDDTHREAVYQELAQYVHDNYLFLPICEGYAAVVARDYMDADTLSLLADAAMPNLAEVRFAN